ncbi:MAG: DNA-formamidopyrimidine glycosylase family protein, partial [Ilumatobacter sp.]
MPEGLEVEIFRRAAARAVGRPIASVLIDGRQEMAQEIPMALVGGSITAARRIGKLLLLDLEAAGAEALGIHFGMTGRLILDGDAPIGALEYGSGRDDSAWDRFVVTFDDGGVMRVNDPRRWARYILDPVEGRLGPD